MAQRALWHKRTGLRELGILRSLGDIFFYVHGVTRCFRDCQAEVKGDSPRNYTQPNDDSPEIIDMMQVLVPEDLLFECHCCDKSNDGRGQVTEPLHSEYCIHHTTTNASSSKFGRNDSRKGILSGIRLLDRAR